MTDSMCGRVGDVRAGPLVWLPAGEVTLRCHKNANCVRGFTAVQCTDDQQRKRGRSHTGLTLGGGRARARPLVNQVVSAG